MSVSQIPKKPRHGAPCNGCGGCCIAEKCALGEAVFGDWRGPCQALELAEAAPGYVCGLVVHPGRYALSEDAAARHQSDVRGGRAPRWRRRGLR